MNFKQMNFFHQSHSSLTSRDEIKSPKQRFHLLAGGHRRKDVYIYIMTVKQIAKIVHFMVYHHKWFYKLSNVEIMHVR